MNGKAQAAQGSESFVPSRRGSTIGSSATRAAKSETIQQSPANPQRTKCGVAGDSSFNRLTFILGLILFQFLLELRDYFGVLCEFFILLRYLFFKSFNSIHISINI